MIVNLHSNSAPAMIHVPYSKKYRRVFRELFDLSMDVRARSTQDARLSSSAVTDLRR
jgi:hypothetical protein